MESSRPKPIKEDKEKEETEKGMALLKRSEEDAVKKFREKSTNLEILSAIVKTSRDSKAKGGIFGGSSFFQQVLYQISPGDENMINDLYQAKTFSELFHRIGLKDEFLENPCVEPLFGKVGIVAQKANVCYYMIGLAKEIKNFAIRNLYELDPPVPKYTYK